MPSLYATEKFPAGCLFVCSVYQKYGIRNEYDIQYTHHREEGGGGVL
jgi:hypothetical protein